MGDDWKVGDAESNSCVNTDPPINPLAPVTRTRGGDDDEVVAVMALGGIVRILG